MGRRHEVHDKLVLIRTLGHQELNLFHKFNVMGWRVSPSDQCYVCEGWRYTVFFYDRRKHIKNKLFDAVTRWIMELVNRVGRTDHRRRVSPTMTAPTLVPHGTIKLSPSLEFGARLNSTVCYLLEQAQMNATPKGV